MPKKNARDAIRARIKAAPAYKSEHVDIPEWDSTVELRSLPVGLRNEIADRMVNGVTARTDLPLEIIVNSAYDEDGSLVFGEADDVAWLRSLPASIVDRLVGPANRLNGMNGELEQNVEDAAKKSDSTEA